MNIKKKSVWCMKPQSLVLLAILVTTLLVPLLASAEWKSHRFNDTELFYDVRCGVPTHATLYLAGTIPGIGMIGVDYRSTLLSAIDTMYGPLIDVTLDTCGVAILPSPVLDSSSLPTWDYTGYTKYGNDARHLISILTSLKTMWDIPIIVIGDDTGATMVHRLGIELHGINRSDLISAMVLSEAVSANSIVVNKIHAVVPPNIPLPVNLSGSPEYHYVKNNHSYFIQGDDWSVAGVPTPTGIWNIPTVIIYSTEDGVIVDTPTVIKQEFAESLSLYGRDVTVYNSGDNRIKEDAWYSLVNTWLYNYRFK